MGGAGKKFRKDKPDVIVSKFTRGNEKKRRVKSGRFVFSVAMQGRERKRGGTNTRKDMAVFLLFLKPRDGIPWVLGEKRSKRKQEEKERGGEKGSTGPFKSSYFFRGIRIKERKRKERRQKGISC